MIIPVIQTMAIVLGLAFDYSSLISRTRYIYNTKAIEDNKVVVTHPFTQSQYTIMEFPSDANDFLDIDGYMSLRAKKDSGQFIGIGDYMKQKIDRENSVEILISVYHETVTESFPSHTELNTDWQNRSPDQVGSHYIRSITYGGQLVISFLLRAKSSEYLDEVKASVTANLALSGSFDRSVKGNIDKIIKDVADKVSIEIHYYATAGVFWPQLKTAEDVFKLVEDYPNIVNKINEGKGAPVKMEIVSLNTIDAKFKPFEKNHALDSLLNEAINKFDDVRTTYDKFKNWSTSLYFDDERQDLIDDFYGNIKSANDAFNKAINEFKPDGETDQFDAAFKAYGEGPDNLPNRFARDLTKLQHAVQSKSARS